MYHLRVQVSDGIHFTNTTVEIEVTDSNDNAPQFNEVTYSFDIPENIAPGYSVGKVQANDLDLGENAQINYKIVSNWASDIFSVNHQTGVITLSGNLDYEEV